MEGDIKPESTDDASSLKDVDKNEGRNEFEEDENKQRGNWSGRLDFVLSLVGFVCRVLVKTSPGKD